VRFFVVSPAIVHFDAELGPMKAPFSHILRTYEGFNRYTADAYGFNNDSILEYKEKNRLLVLGDSFVEAKHVSREKNFVARLSKLPDTQAYNAGYSGADPRSFSVLTSRFLAIVRPTQLVLCVNADDLTEIKSDSLPKYTPPTGVKAWLQPLFAHSALATHLNWKYKPVVQAWWKKWTHVEKHKALNGSNAVYLHRWAAILEQLKLYHVPILLVVLPSIHYELGQAYAVNNVKEEGLVSVAQIKGITVLRTEKIFIQDFLETKQVAFGFMNSRLGSGHLNEHGHSIVFLAISKTLGLPQ